MTITTPKTTTETRTSSSTLVSTSTSSSLSATPSTTGVDISPDGTCGNKAEQEIDLYVPVLRQVITAENISPNGLCGAAHDDYTCLGSQFGSCSSIYGYCCSSTN
ncbi:hypothetical protein BO86DRAFT_379581 [Aspergillus japonicus CBS 114.51]|uniref:Uncharacterized protein n=1 Tax=Aspergillus japonicus CBS 114.51 TaxID=1448312 RepID=A0A8T8X033_ASPJA|nr:hypothetical protein BO86DRAFT_379581 [Aspergillus japonicus CBS 114.51]RAH81506.1 hypothetical protein BO86DRAFT_379581 [Aspergillus japonicus CBS 114.51]